LAGGASTQWPPPTALDAAIRRGIALAAAAATRPQRLA